jgi:hypothetical protein
VTLTLLRVVVVGGVQFATVALLLANEVILSGADPLLKLVLLIECAVPSANMVVRLSKNPFQTMICH